MSQSDIPLNDAEVQNIKQIISTFNDSSLNYLDLELGDLKIKIGKGALPGSAVLQPLAQPIPVSTVAQSVPSSAMGGSAAVDLQAALGADEVQIKSPLVGRYYSQAEPGAKKYVDVGVEVQADTTVALIEAMKMFNAVPAGVKGHISKICVSDGDLVEYGQVLFHVKVK